MWFRTAVIFQLVFIVYILSQFKWEGLPRLEALETEVQSLHQTVGRLQGEREVFLRILILKQDIDLELARRIAHAVHEQARIFKRDPDFVLAIIKHESNFDPAAKSEVGALGLMQVMPHWLEVFGVEEDLTDITVSIKRGLQVYGFYEKTYNGSTEMALTAYNRGSWKVEEDIRLGNDPLNGYAKKVLTIYERLKEMR
jgi:soluble lytic murein transglycosylase-like protein